MLQHINLVKLHELSRNHDNQQTDDTIKQQRNYQQIVSVRFIKFISFFVYFS